MDKRVEHSAVDMLFKKMSQPIEHTVQRRHTNAEERTHYLRLFKQTMQVTAQYVARSVLPSQTGYDLPSYVALGDHGWMLNSLSVVNFIAHCTDP